MNFSEASLEELLSLEGHACACGRNHATTLEYLKIEAGAIRFLPKALRAVNVSRPFIVCDPNTRKAALAPVEAVLKEAGIAYTLYSFRTERVEPDEHAMGALCMAFDRRCDGVLAVGSGVINDCCKVLAHTAGVKSMIVATAPSMDGYASDSASMIQNRVKVSLYNACPAAIIADTDIIKNAPMRMLWAGLGDMLAKYVSICEWRISNLVTGEYYCENIASLVRASLRKIVSAAPGMPRRDPAAVEATVEGLVLSGIAMSYAKISRPASGLEHYFSHLWEMAALDRGDSADLHGIQVGVGTLLSIRLLQRLKSVVPSRERAEAFIRDFSDAEWQKQTRAIFGGAAQTVIDAEHETFRKNDPKRHAARLNNLLNRWPDIQKIIKEELPDADAVEKLMRSVGMPCTPAEIGISPSDIRSAYLGSRDIRDKYLTSSIFWDLGMLSETAEWLV